MNNIINIQFKQRQGHQVDIYDNRAPVVACISPDNLLGSLVSVYAEPKDNHVVQWDRQGTFIVCNIVKGKCRTVVNPSIKSYSAATQYAKLLVCKYLRQEVI